MAANDPGFSAKLLLSIADYERVAEALLDRATGARRAADLTREFVTAAPWLASQQ